MNFPALLQSFFAERLLQCGASAHTISAYRDSFRLLLRFAAQRLAKPPCELSIEDLDAPFLGRFLEHLERGRGNSARTRNARLSALRSFFRYVALNEPAHSLHCQRILAMRAKRHERRPIDYLQRPEIEALLLAPDPCTRAGRRDRALLTVAVQTGLRVSELTGLRVQDVVLGPGAHVRCRGKGRKQRSTPLRRDAAAMLKAWLAEMKAPPSEPAFPSLRGGPLSRDAVERIVAKHAASAARCCPSLKNKKATPHMLRHTAAMDLLHNGVDCAVIALWLGHESVETTQMYLHADMSLKEKALALTAPLGVAPGRYRPNDKLLAFLESL